MENKIEVSAAAVKEILPFLNEKLDRLIVQRDGISTEIDHTRATIEEFRTKLKGKNLPVPAGTAVRKRLPKGFAGLAVEKAFKAIPAGQSMTPKELVSATGIKYSTIIKLLTDKDRNVGKFVQNDDKSGWKLK